MAKLYFRYSAMNSGKSTALLQAAFNYEERGMRAAILKPAIDSKGEDAVVSRLGIERKVDYLIGPQDTVAGTLKGEKLDCLLVDEAQFLTPTQIDELFWYAVNQNVPVLAYGLRTDFSMTAFPGASRLLELAHEIQELKTICRCGKKAVLNGRKINGKFVFEGDQVAIDGQGNIEYESLCASCYQKFKQAETTQS
jgi:thymidine kinase